MLRPVIQPSRKKPVKVSPAAVVSTARVGTALWKRRICGSEYQAPSAPSVSMTAAFGYRAANQSSIASGAVAGSPLICAPSISFTRNRSTLPSSHSSTAGSKGEGLSTTRIPRAWAASMISPRRFTSFCSSTMSPSPKPESASAMYSGVTRRLVPP